MDALKLLTLACIAYKERHFEEAGKLFAAAMDAGQDELLLELATASDLELLEQQFEVVSSSETDIQTVIDAIRAEYVSLGMSDDEEAEWSGDETVNSNDESEEIHDTDEESSDEASDQVDPPASEGQEVQSTPVSESASCIRFGVE